MREILCGVMLCALAVAAASSQTPTPGTELRFEVASIKPNTTLSRGISGQSVVVKGRYTVINYPLRFLVADAFGLRGPDQVLGGPPWVDSAKYDISAMTDIVTPTGAQNRSLLQALLKDRFRLVARQEIRDTPIYELVIARTDGRLGTGLQPSTVDCRALAASGKGTCGQSAGGFRHTATGQPISNLISQLSRSVDRRIVDRTGLSGRFDWELQTQADPNDTTAPSIFTALQEQLGLKLNPSRGPLDVVVIDRIEPPSPD